MRGFAEVYASAKPRSGFKEKDNFVHARNLFVKSKINIGKGNDERPCNTI